MGQFLAVGLIKDLRIQKPKDSNQTMEAYKAELKTFGFDLDLYTVKEETETFWSGRIKTELLTDTLIPFTKKMYEQLSIFSELDDTQEVIAALEKTTDIQALLDDAGFYNFQKDNYGESERLSINGKSFSVSFKAVFFYIAGKIMMESNGGLFQLYSVVLQNAMSEFELSKALRVYITG